MTRPPVIFDIRELIERSGQKLRTPIAFRPITPPSVLASDLFASAYRPVIAVWEAAIPTITAEYERTLAQMTTDAPADVSARITQAEAQANAVMLRVSALLSRWTSRLEDWQRRKWVATVLTATNVDLATLIGPGDARETLEAVLVRNVGLVRSVSEGARRRIEAAAFNGLTARKSARDVANEIRESVGIERRRALRIASNETTTLASQLNQERRRQIGIDTFEWVSSGKLHPREDHKARNGMLYSENTERQGQEYRGKRIRKPPDRSDWPGIPINCACTERAVLII